MAIDYNKLLNPSDVLNSSLPAMVEAFVSFYGEESRARIEEKFNNMLLFGYHSFSSINYILNHILDKNSFPDKYRKYELYCSSMKQLEEKLSIKYNRKLLEDFAALLPEKYKKMIKQNASSFQKLVGDITEGNGLINFFKTEISEILNDSQTSTAEKESIKQGRISYFKTFGFDHGLDYEAYINDEECQSVIPNDENLRLLDEISDEYFMEKEYEISLSTFDYRSIRQKIDREGFLLKEDGYDAELISEPYNCIYTNAKEINGEYKDYPIVYISMSGLPQGNESLDVSLIHELNHRFEMDLIALDDNGITTKNGWEEIYDEFGSKQERDRKYELLNEAINELLAQDITKHMHALGLYIFDTPGTVVRETTDYAMVNFIVRDFYDKYKEDIIKSRAGLGGIASIKDKVGHDNFEALNSLVNNFWSDANDSAMVESLSEPKRVIIKEEADKIIAEMDVYNCTNQIEQSSKKQ